ncbi:MAG: aminotransferase class III-fold pyridoxal phosphate-dependent enzyme, partial [Bacilli bacterium]
MNDQKLKNLDEQYIMNTYLRNDLVLSYGEGSYLYTKLDEAYLDFTAGIGVNCLGHNNPLITNAIVEQASKLLHTSNLYYTSPQIELAHKLSQITEAKKVFFANSGSEANECAIKIARKYGQLHKDGAYEIIGLKNAFHGRTLGSLSLTPQ